MCVVGHDALNNVVEDCTSSTVVSGVPPSTPSPTVTITATAVGVTDAGPQCESSSERRDVDANGRSKRNAPHSSDQHGRPNCSTDEHDATDAHAYVETDANISTYRYVPTNKYAEAREHAQALTRASLAGTLRGSTTSFWGSTARTCAPPPRMPAAHSRVLSYQRVSINARIAV